MPEPANRSPSLARFELAVESADIGVYEFDVRRGLTAVSDAYIRQLGYSRSEWADTYAHWAALVHPDDLPRVVAILADFDNPAVPYTEIEYRLRHRDGSWRWVHDRGCVIERDASGRALRSVGIHLVVDELQAARTQLLEANRRFEIAADAGNIGFWEYDMVNDRQYWDDRALRMHGVKRENFTADGAAWMRLVHPDDLPAVVANVEAAWAGSAADVTSEFRIIRPDGEVRHIRSHARITRDGRGRATRMIGVNLDITQARLARQALTRAAEEAKAARREAERQRRAAERASREKSLFLANMSHEVRTPLSALIALSQAMWMESERHRLPPRFEKFLNRVRSGGKYLNLVLTNLLDVTSAEAGRSKVVPESFYLADWAEDVRDILDPIAGSHGVRVRWKLPSDGEIRLRTDRMRLTQVLLNLGHNAIKFSQGPRKAVDIAITHGSDGLRLRVEDRGPGIPASRLRNIHLAFEQHRVAGSSFDRGVGLGLAVVSSNLNLLGGAMVARRRKPRGMSFEVTIPDNIAPRSRIRRKVVRSARKRT